MAVDNSPQVNAYIQDRLASALSVAGDLRSQATTYAQQAIAAADGYIVANDLPVIQKPTIAVQKYSPDTDLGDLFETEYNGALKDLRDLFLPMIDTLTSKYFPDIDTLTPKLVEWLEGAISRGGAGLPVEVENATWQRGRDRIAEQLVNAKENAMKDLASRGIFMPSGALMARFQQADVEGNKAIADLNRDTTIDAYKQRLETVKFAISEGIGLQRGVFDSVTRVVSEYVRLGAIAGDKANGLISAKRALWDSSASYYRTLVDVERLKFDIDRTNIDSIYKIDELNIRAFDISTKSRVTAATSVADMFSRTAASYMNAQNTVVQLSNTK